MKELKTFEQFGNVALADFKPKPSTKTPEQLEASCILWAAEGDKTKIEYGNAQRALLLPTEPQLLSFVTYFTVEFQ